MKIGTYAHAIDTAAPDRPNGHVVRIVGVSKTRKSRINPNGLLYRGVTADGALYDLEPDQVVERDPEFQSFGDAS